MPSSSVLFVISEVDGSWNVYRHAEDIAPVAVGLPFEADALDISLPLAEVDRPSRVIKIDRRGHQTEIASFAANE